VAQQQCGENEKINEIERTRDCSQPRATSLKKRFRVRSPAARATFKKRKYIFSQKKGEE
jgi:hypothetical protein